MAYQNLTLKHINDYTSFMDRKTMDEIHDLAIRLSGEHIEMISSTPSGGGVAEILNSLVVLMNSLGVEVGWRIIKGSDNFFQVTKEFHNALQGGSISLTAAKKRLYEQTNFDNSLMMHLEKHDLVVVHDPQPLPLITSYKKRIPWIWRFHPDMSRPNKNLLSYLKPFIERYDAMIITTPSYEQSSLKLKQIVIPPSIDPLSNKNRVMPKSEIASVLKRHGIRLNKPIVAQVSRFDKWKDPVGVVKVFKEVRKHMNCQLVLMGNMAIDDPEGPAIYREVMKETNGEFDITVLLNVPDNDRTVNALQRASSIILQKSKKEGFGMTVTEALWKGTPVVGTKVGGIPLQVIDGKTGILVDNNTEAADACVKILKNPSLRNRLGKGAKEHVRKNFLITRHLLDYLRLFDYYLNRQHRFNIGFDYPYA